ncbi:hypothetical protein [Dryocola sp. LX212]
MASAGGMNEYETSVFFRSPVRLAISAAVANGERARGFTPIPWRPRRPANKSPLKR